MNKKSCRKIVLTSLLTLAGLGTFPGCGQKAEVSTSNTPKATVQQVEEQKIKDFEKAAKEIPIFRDELPHAMILSDGKGGYVQMLYPVKRAGVVLESKDQYEKRVQWLNKKYPVDLPMGSLSLRGCKWEDYTTQPKMPFVSMFDKKEYIQHHIAWMEKLFEKSKQKYIPQNDPVALWWVENELPRQLVAEHKNKKADASSNKGAER